MTRHCGDQDCCQPPHHHSSKKYILDIYFNVQYRRSMITLGILGGWSVLRALEDRRPYLLLLIVPPMSTYCSKGGPP